MYVLKINTTEVAYYFAERIETVYPYGYLFNPDSFWELFDCCLVEPQLQNFKDTSIYEAYTYNVKTSLLDNVFYEVVDMLNKILDKYIVSKFRSVLPDRVDYLGSGMYQVYWRN